MRAVNVFRILMIILIIAIIICTLSLFDAMTGTRVIRIGEYYAYDDESFTVAVYDDCEELTVSGSYTEFYEITKNERDISRPIIYMENEANTIFLDEARLYNLTVPIGGECQLYARCDEILGASVYVCDLIAGRPMTDLLRDDIYLYYGGGSERISITDERRDGLYVTETVNLSFGETYYPSKYFFGTALTATPTGRLDGRHFEVYDESGKRADNALVQDKNGSISVLSTEGGYFKIYSDRTGGVLIPFTVSTENSPILDVVIDSYEYETGIRLTPDQVTPEIMNNLTELQTDSIPPFLTESIFSSLLPNIETLRVHLNGDVDGNMLYSLPGSLKNLELVNTGTNPVTVNASFTGGGGNARLTLSGNITVAGNGTDPTFFDFAVLTVDIGRAEDPAVRVNITSKNATTAAPDAIGVFSDIKKLTLNAGNAPLTVRAGNGASLSHGLRSGNGGTAIDCDELIIDCSYNVSVYGGNGGRGYEGKDGNPGYYSGSGENTTAYYYSGTDGGNGGNGGNAITAARLKLIGSAELDVYGGNGGNGGKGGDGGRGANKDVLSFWDRSWHGIKDGRGGDGGCGGNGGDGGYSLLIGEKLESYSKINAYASAYGAAGGRGIGGYSRSRTGDDGKLPGTDGTSHGYLVMSGVIIGNTPIESQN